MESQTLSEETKGADAVVLAKLLKEAPTATDPNDPNSGMATFQIAEVLHGPESLKPKQEISVVFFGDTDRDKTYLVTGLGTENTDWTTPLPLTPTAVDYIRKLPSVPPAGAERLEYFQDYLENPDPLLAQDAYDEFGRAPYSDAAGSQAENETRPDREVGRGPRGQPEPAAVVPDDARRVRHQGGCAVARRDDSIRLR